MCRPWVVLVIIEPRSSKVIMGQAVAHATTTEKKATTRRSNAFSNYDDDVQRGGGEILLRSTLRRYLKFGGALELNSPVVWPPPPGSRHASVVAPGDERTQGFDYFFKIQTYT